MHFIESDKVYHKPFRLTFTNGRRDNGNTIDDSKDITRRFIDSPALAHAVRS